MMIRLLLVFIVIFAAYLGFSFVQEHDGPVAIELFGYLIKTSAFMLVGTVLLFSLSISLIFQLFKIIASLPKSIADKYSQSKLSKGYEVLLEGYGDITNHEAKLKNQKNISKIFQNSTGEVKKHAALILAAGSPNNDEKIYYYKELCNFKDQRFKSYVHLAKLHLEINDANQALYYVNEASNFNDSDFKLLIAKLHVYAVLNMWSKYLFVIDSLKKMYGKLISNDLSEQIGDHLYKAAKDEFSEGNIEAAESYLKRSLDFSPLKFETLDLISTLYLSQNKPAYAVDILKKAFAARPDVNVGELLARALDGTPEEKMDIIRNEIDNPEYYRDVLILIAARLNILPKIDMVVPA